MKKYSARIFVDMILCSLAAAGLSVNAFSGFEMRGPWQGDLISSRVDVFLVTAAVASAMMMVLFAAHLGRFGFKASAAFTVAILVGTGAALYQAGAFLGKELIDGTAGLFWIITALTAVAIFWCTRTNAGILAMFFAGSIMTAALDFLEYPVLIPGYFLFLFCIAALFLYRASSNRSFRPAPGRMAAILFLVQPAAIAFIATLLALGLSFGASEVMPTPDHAELVRDLMSMDLLQDLGISSRKVIVAEESDLLKQQESQTEQQVLHEEERQDPDVPQQSGWIGSGDQLIRIMAIRYEKKEKWLWAAIPILVLVGASAVMVKLLFRRRWYNGVLKKNDEDGAVELYRYFLKKLKTAGFQKPEGNTLLEYCAEEQRLLDGFQSYDSGFLQLTESYLGIVYGSRKISYSEYERFHDVYLGFHKNLRKTLGIFRYCKKFFLL